MFHIIRTMADLQEWHQALGLVPITTVKSSNVADRKWTNWQPQITSNSSVQRDILKRKERNKLRMRQIRALEDVEKADRRREKNKLRMRQVRALETEEQAEQRREKNKLRMRQVRAVEKMDSESNIEHSTSEVNEVAAENINNGICDDKQCQTVQTDEDTSIDISSSNKICA